MSTIGEAVKPILIDQTAQPVLMIRERTAIPLLPITIGESYLRITHYLEELGESPKDAPYTAYFNFNMQNLEVEMGFPVSRILPGKGEIKSRIIPGGKALMMMFKGPYSELDQAYDEMFKWIDDNGYENTGVYYEYYYNSLGEVPDSELLTRIVIPLE